MEPSKRSTRPRSEADAEGRGVVQAAFPFSELPAGAQEMDESAVRQPLRQRCLEQPLVLRKSRETSTILTPFQVDAQAVLVGNGCDNNSLNILPWQLRRTKASTSFARTTTAMRSCDSEIASSVPSRPSYFFGNGVQVDVQTVEPARRWQRIHRPRRSRCNGESCG